MNWVADENIDQPVVEALRRAGHSVWAVSEQAVGLIDDLVLERARQDGAILMTADKDFGELVFRRRLATSGVFLLRLAGKSPEEKADLVMRIIERHGEELPGAFAVLDRAALRVRRTS